jgi:D-glycero-alpha-D-manno-heptose-7-phosphate kinase
MIISRTPLRISFFSGGSDMPAFYQQETGAALSVTIDKYIYVMVHKTPHLGIRTVYDTIEETQDLEKMQHIITKECLKYYDLNSELTIASVSDILAKGSGLGSSSAFTVGLINALHHVSNNSVSGSRYFLANSACDVEMNKCNYPVGKQDQYAAAYGGFNLFEFNKDGTVNTNNFHINKNTLEDLQSNLMLVYSGKGRSANSILQKQKAAMSDKQKFGLVKRSRNKAYVAQEMLATGKIDDFGNLLHEAWMDKKGVVSDISADYFDNIYDTAMKNGALGGKLLGAGGGGFFLFYVPKEKQGIVKEQLLLTSLYQCAVYDFNFVDHGSQIVGNF